MKDTSLTKQNIKQFCLSSGGILYVVSTPIGNLEDITFRAVNILQQVDLIACEDTRHSKKLLNYYNIKTPCVSYHDHSDESDRQILVNKLLAGKKLALISDSGTPLISDPGYKLVIEAIKNEIKVVPVPGACAAIAALSVSGLPSDSFVFIGFLPRTHKACCEKLTAVKKLPATLICYESPKRLKKTLAVMIEILGNRQATVARELTKIHEEVLNSDLKTLYDIYKQRSEIKGEVVLLVEGQVQETEVPQDKIREELELLLKDLTLRDAVAEMVALYSLPKKEVYDIALSIKRKLR